jgi:L-ascorbate metabolism protein UlaG (beta-lactamase superfamily)
VNARSIQLALLAVGCLLASVRGVGEELGRADALYAAEPMADAVTFWGHATSYIDIDGFGIVTDPIFDPAYGMLHRRKIPVPPPSAFDQTSVILISHAHRDHLSTDTLARFPASVTVLCSGESAGYLSELGFQVETMEPGDEYAFPAGTIIAVRADHPGSKWSLDSEPDGRALGFVIQTPDVTLYYSGDSDYFEGFAEVGRTYAPDLALININAHLNGEDALSAIEDLGAPPVIPFHHGAYNSINELRSTYWHDELERAIGSGFVRIGVGESFPFSRLATP